MIKDDRKISDDRTKEKCFKYFRGESTYEDEVSIRESLSEGRLSMDDFRAMEKDWCENERPTAGQRMAYARLTGSINARRWKRLLMRISVPVAAAVAAIVALFINLINDKENPVSTFSTAYLETKMVVLPDSSKVWLNSATTLTYDSDFNKKDREVTLSGEAFFDVSKNPSKPLRFAYNDEDTTEEKIEKVAKNIYGAASVSFGAAAKKKLQMIKELGFERFPVCIAKTQYSFSTDPKLYCVAKGFDFNVRDIVINAGAEMIVAIAGNIMRMPGLPKVPAAMHIDIVNGQIEGLS